MVGRWLSVVVVVLVARKLAVYHGEGDLELTTFTSLTTRPQLVVKHSWCPCSAGGSLVYC